MAFTEIYVDPSIAADSGAGTIGDPAGDLEWYIEQNDWPAAPTRVNIKAGTDEVLGAELSVAMASVAAPGKSVAWVPTITQPLVFQGYTAAADDGGIGGISGGGAVSIIDSVSLDYVHFRHLHLHNTGAAVIIDMDNYGSVTNCEVENTTGNGIEVDDGCVIASNYIHNLGGIAVTLTGASTARFNRVVDNHASNDMNIAIYAFGGGSMAERNLVYMTGNGQGISVRVGGFADRNSVYSSTASTGKGIVVDTNLIAGSITNNLVEGFSGAGGTGIDLSASGAGVIYYGGNAVFNCTTAYPTPSGEIVINLGDNETLSASPFTDAANQDFSPVDTGSVKEGHLPASFP